MKPWLIPAGIAFLDGAIKHVAEKKLSGGRTRTILGGRVRLRLFCNPGAAFGAFKKNPNLLLAMHSAMLGAAAATLAELPQKGKNLKKAGLSLLLGGGASNLADRLGKGGVTDYFSFTLKNARGPVAKLRGVVMNCSDLFIFLGGIIYAISSRTDHKRSPACPKTALPSNPRQSQANDPA